MNFFPDGSSRLGEFRQCVGAPLFFGLKRKIWHILNRVKKKIKGTGRWKKTLLAAGAISAIAGSAGYFWLRTGGLKEIQVPAYTVTKVYDGDTFETKEKQVIRLANIDAPEMGSCGSEEAKTELEKLILNKPVYLKIVYKDEFLRLVSWVYAGDSAVNLKMLESGWAYYRNRVGSDDVRLQKAAELGKNKKIGIFSKLCTQEINPKQPDCVVKGNIRQGDSQKIYHFPGCGQYNNSLVQLYMGDQWFCTEKEAGASGFIKGADCFGKKWK